MYRGPIHVISSLHSGALEAQDLGFLLTIAYLRNHTQ